MPYPSLTFANLLESATRTELEQFVSLLQGYLSAQHKDDGSHSAVTADSVDVTGDLSADGTITADADGSPVLIGATDSGPGIDIYRTVSGVLTHWRLFADVSSGSPMLAIKDVGQVADASALDIIRTVSGAAPEYTFRPHSSAHQLKLGADSAGQRWAGVYASTLKGFTQIDGTSLMSLSNGRNDNVSLPSGAFVWITGPTAAFQISGIAAGADGQRLTLSHNTGFLPSLNNGDVNSSAANRIYNSTGAAVSLGASVGVAILQYTTQLPGWVVISVR